METLFSIQIKVPVPWRCFSINLSHFLPASDFQENFDIDVGENTEGTESEKETEKYEYGDVEVRKY